MGFSAGEGKNEAEKREARWPRNGGFGLGLILGLRQRPCKAAGSKTESEDGNEEEENCEEFEAENRWNYS